MNEWFDAEEHVERAHELYEAGRWSEAEAELREALARNPLQSEWHFNLALTLEADERLEEALRSFARSHELDPGDGQPALMAGHMCLRLGRPEDAIQWFGRTQDLDPDRAASYVGRIEAYASLGQHEQAELMFYLAQQADPDDAEAYACMADSLLARDLHERAVWCLREAARLDASLPRIEARLAEVYWRTGRPERARQLYLRELRREPGDIDTLLDLSRLLIEMNRPQEAGEKLRRVLEIEPDHAEAHLILAELAEAGGDVDDAVTHCDVALRLDGSIPGVRRRLADLLLRRGGRHDPGRARDLLLDEFASLRNRAEVFTGEDRADLGRLLLHAGLAPEAIRVLRPHVEAEPGDAESLHALSVALFEVGRYEQGLESARRAVRLDPRHVPAMHNLALANVQLGQWSRARYWVAQALAIDAEDASLRRLRVQLAMHTMAEAIEWAFTRSLAALRSALSLTLRRRLDSGDHTQDAG